MKTKYIDGQMYKTFNPKTTYNPVALVLLAVALLAIADYFYTLFVAYNLSNIIH